MYIIDSGYDLKSENGYFKTDEEDVYFLDYDNAMVKSDVSSAINPQTMAGVILQNDFYHNINPSGEIITLFVKAHAC